MALVIMALGCLLGAARVWTHWQVRGAVEVAPDGVERFGPVLRPDGRYEVRVVVRGVIHGRFSGADYDATTVAAPGQPPRPHAALELNPGTLREVPAAGLFSRREFAPQDPAAANGEPVRVRLDPDRLIDPMQLPPDERDRALEGTLVVEVRERDRLVQRTAAALLACIALGFLGTVWGRRTTTSGDPK
jgi:hypothetical protein